MKVLITGGFGYLGENIAKFLKEKGYDIRIFSIKHHESKKEKYETQIGNILSKIDLKKACKGVDHIIHLAALSNPEMCKKDPLSALEINGFGTRNVLEVGEEIGIKKFIYVSSFHVYGNSKGKITEETPTKPLNDYGITKLLGELYCRQISKKMNYVILRLSNSYGPSLSDSGWNLVVNNLCKQCYKNKEIILKSKGVQKGNFVSINDINQAIHLILKEKPERIKGEIFNVGGNDTISISELANIVAQLYKEAYGKDAKIIIPKDVENKPLIDFDYRFDKIKNIGYEPRFSLKKGIINIFKTLEND